MCGKQTEIEPEYSLLQTSVHYQKPKLHTTQANEINVCTECNTDKEENSSCLKFQDKIKNLPNLFQTVIVLQCLIISIILLGIYYESWHQDSNLEKRGKQNKKLSRQDGGKI